MVKHRHVRYEAVKHVFFSTLLVFWLSPQWVLAEPFVYQGRGESMFSARQDAIRAALQEQMSQLIVADRATTDTDIIYNEIVSTMNGYVDDFKILNFTHDTAGEYVVTARISISKEMIENYISIVSSAAGEIDGENLFSSLDKRQAEQEAANLRAAANGYLFKRMFRGYPTDVYQVEVLGMELASPGPNQHQIYLELELTPDPSFVQLVKDTVRILSYDGCKLSEGGEISNGGLFSRPAPVCDNAKQGAEIVLEYANTFPDERNPHPTEMCYDLNAQLRCFLMKPGLYWQTPSDENVTTIDDPKIGIAVDIVDRQGRSTLESKDCLTYWARGIRDQEWPADRPIVDRIARGNLSLNTHLIFSDSGRAAFSDDDNLFRLSLDPQRVAIILDSREFNVRNATEINLLVFHKMRMAEWKSIELNDSSPVIFSAYQNQQWNLCSVVKRGSRR